MHGVRRDRTQQSAELRAQRKEREARKLELYLQTEKRFFDLQKQEVMTQEALDATTRLLNINPELYTAWNYRRKILTHLFAEEESNRGNGKGRDEGSFQNSDDAGSKTALLREDLDLTTQALQMHPKVYWIWNHRKWCLQSLPAGEADSDPQGIAKWQRELKVIDRMLELDARNFHGWNYRRYIYSQLALPRDLGACDDSTLAAFPQSLINDVERLSPELKAHQLKLARAELRYTLSKIESNFSNFSAWHQRSLFLPAIWSAGRLDDDAKREARDVEFELVRQAMFVDPDDQSVWTYHEWLVDLDASKEVLDREIASIKELLELEPDSRWCMQSLALYLRLYKDPAKDAEALVLLEKLAQTDTDRKGRYEDVINEIKAASIAA